MTEEVPVLVVGGGGAGLTASMLLARMGVEHLVINARAETSDLPKAHVLNQRAMEILDDVGAAEELANLRRLWSGRPQDAEQRSAVLRHMRAQSMEFSELNVELGYRYESAAIAEVLAQALGKILAAPIAAVAHA
jgi:2-polyprenyl-6-methoxyphenol hydroxylase-like FAD-dependent oxidoreductase